MHRGEGLGRKFGGPITELVVTHRDEAAILSEQGMADCEGRPTPITMGQQVGWINAIVQKEGVPPILRP